MKHFNRYIPQSLSQPEQLRTLDYGPEMVVVIPAFNEPQILNTLNSLLETNKPGKIAVLIVVNYPENACYSTKAFNKYLYDILKDWVTSNSTEELHFELIYSPDLRRKHAGAGLARKIGMDTAVGVFAQKKQENGIIISLDADCLVDRNYFEAIAARFKNQPKTNAVVIDFRHRTDTFNATHVKAIEQYEAYLHYFVLGCRLAGFPYAYHTIGSSFAVKADTYAKQGGMNKRHAGEDFYFLHKIFPLGYCSRVYDARVYPSGRASVRVPFGTGPAVNELLSNRNLLLVYHPLVFVELSAFYHNLSVLWHKGEFFSVMPDAFRLFWAEKKLDDKLNDAMKHSSSEYQFKRRILHHFDAFQLVKYLNFAHKTGFYKKMEIKQALSYLLRAFHQTPEKSLPGLLKQMRYLERANPPGWPE